MKTTLRKKHHSRKKRQRTRRLLRLALSVICLCALVWGGSGLIRFCVRSRNTHSLNRELEQVYRQENIIADTTAAIPSPTAAPAALPADEPRNFQFITFRMQPNAQKLLERNPDYVAWIEMPDVLSLPVVYRDNEHYLTHDFDGRESDSGTLFLDQYHPFAADSQYLVVHGHAMEDGSMFGALVKFRKDGYLAEHEYLYLDTLYRREVYRAVAVLDVSEEEMYTLMRLGSPGFLNDAEFALFAQRIEENALHLSGESLNPADSLLALSTCWKDGRIVVLYKRV